MTSVAIVGAGLAGLACATTLSAVGVEVRIFEASDRVGGRVRSDCVEGYVLDRGFQVLLTAYPEAQRQLDMNALDLRPFAPGALMVFDDGRSSIVADPFRDPRHLFSTIMSPIGSPVDKLRLALLRRRLSNADPAELLRRPDRTTRDHLIAAGFSERMIDRFFRPLFGGIQLDPQLTTSSRMFDIIFRMLSDGESVVPAAGMQAIPDQLAARLPAGAIELGVRCTAVSPGRVGTDGGTFGADVIVVATEGPAAAELLGETPLGSRSVGAVWFSADEPPTDQPLVVLDAMGGPVLNAAVMSNVAPTYAPPGRHLVVAALPGYADGDLETMARRTFRGWWGTQVDGWEHLATNRIAHGQPAQPPPLAPKQRTLVGDGIHVCGDHRDTASIQGALYSGRRCAEAILATTA